MTRRQINLYDPGLRRQQDLLTLPRLLVMALTVAVLSLLTGVWARSDLPELRERVKQGAVELESLRQQEAALKERLAARKPDSRLLHAIEVKTRRLAFMSEILARIKEQLQSNVATPVEVLTALARQASEGVWLIAVEYDPASGHMALHGRVRDPAFLPAYIARLENEPIFRGKRFVAFEARSGSFQSETERMSSDGDTHASGRTAWYEFALLPEAASPRDQRERE